MQMMFTPLDLLHRPDVRKEIELLEDQAQQLQGLDEKMRDRIRELSNNLRDRPPGGNREPRREDGGPAPRGDMRGMMDQVNKEVRAELSQILLPHQMKRLDQLAMQMRLRGGGMALLSGDLTQELGITDDQRDQLRTKAEGIERESQRKIAEIRRKAQEEVISLLSSDQQAKIRELIGHPFDFENQPPPPAQPNRGDRPRPEQN